MKLKRITSLNFIKKNLKYLYIVIICFLILVPLSILIWSNSEYSYIYSARKILKNEKDSLAGYQLYLTLYPNGKYIQEAREKINNNKNIRYLSTNSWRERDITDIFGDATGEKMIYNEFVYIINPHSYGFKDNGEIIITNKDIYFDFHPDTDSRESQYHDYKFDGKYFKFRYKVEGEKINNDLITSEYIYNKGYKLPNKWTNTIQQWRREKSIVKFVGIGSNDNGEPKEIQFTIQF